MPLQQTGSIRYYSFDIFEGTGICQAIFTRRGGVSPSPWSSLNVGSTVGDTMENVVENRRRSFHAVGRDISTMYDVWQVHSVSVVCTDRPRPPEIPHIKADIILTDRHDVTLYMRFADCVPVLLYDPRHHVVGLVHAGWPGTVNEAAGVAVKAMEQTYGCRPADILAGIGPSIGVDHYPVGEDVLEKAKITFGKEFPTLIEDGACQPHLNLWKANELSLARAGVRQIQVAGICTACQTEDWFSHRAEKGKTGRFGGLIAL